MTRKSGSLLAWWSGLARRERAMVIAAIAVVAAALLYLVGIEPAWRERARLLRDLPQLQEQAALVEALRAEALAIGGGGTTRGVDRAAVEQSLARAGLAASVKDAAGRLDISVRGAPAQAWFAWLEACLRESRLRVVQARVSRASASGLVDADVGLAASAT